MLQATSKILLRKGFRRPTVVLDADRARANIRRMADRADQAGALFRPHFKTHQSGAVAVWFRDAGVDRITVSSLDMAEHFAGFGWRNITVALLHNPRETRRAVGLAAQLASAGGGLGLVCDDPRVAGQLAAALSDPTDIWLKIDTGYCRTGIPWSDGGRLDEVLDACGGRAVPVGLLTHAGHSYHVGDGGSVRKIAAETIARLTAARAACKRDDLLLSFGDTPCCSLSRDLSDCDEIRPGNFVFYDLMQLQIGSCRSEDLAAAVVCPVLGVYPERRQAVIHGGAVHLSKESLTRPDGGREYGRLGTVTPDGFGAIVPDATLVSLSQEHGVVQFDGSEMPELAPGDMVLVWPVHSCLVCDLSRDQMAEPVLIGAEAPL